MKVVDINIEDVPQFSTRDKAFLLENDTFRSFQKYPSGLDSFEDILSDRSEMKCDRQLIVSVLQDQYKAVSSSAKTKSNISAISKDNTFTIVTAHQPSLMTGPLYYVFKILSAIKLAADLSKKHPEKQIVPIFILGSEDHDFDEINHFYLFGQKISWEEDGEGSVGLFPTKNLEVIINQTIEKLGTNNKASEILKTLKADMSSFKNYSDFAFRLTHLLFDHFGLIILRMDDRRMKEAFIPIIKQEVLERASEQIVKTTQENIKDKLGLDAQAFPREINFFYTKGRTRNRIEYTNGHYEILDTAWRFSEAEIIEEIDNYPERFSPNVIMRPLYQEYILPNLAYIGGGGELAYWLERKTQFEHYKVSYPLLVRRTSGMFLSSSSQKQLSKLDFDIRTAFSDEQTLINQFIDNSEHPEYDLSNYSEELETIFNSINKKVESIDKTLVKTTHSELAKAQKSIAYLESKLKKAIKQKESVNINRIAKMKQQLFPNGLQERHDNIFQYLATQGPQLIDELLEHCDPFDKKMKVFVFN